MNNIILEAKTNSSRLTPEAAVFDESELNLMVEKYNSIVNFESNKSVLSIKINDVPLCAFSRSDGCEMEEPDLEYWEPVATDLSSDKLTMIFVHSHDGSELFFQYTIQK